MRSTVCIGFSIATMLFCFVGASQASNSSGANQTLPSASDFRLTLTEDRHSKLPLGPSCAGVASKTLTCRAFKVTLENLSDKAVQVNWGRCNDPAVRIDHKMTSSHDVWWPVSWINDQSVKSQSCRQMKRASIRLKAGGKFEYLNRMISPHRDSQFFAPGSYTLRAQWVLFGCMEEPQDNDCLAPLPVAGTRNMAALFNSREPITIFSNEITVDAPVLPDLGRLKVALDVSARSGPPPANLARKSADCTGDAGNSIDCVVFHYAIHNLGDRPIRNARYTCDGIGIAPEYRPAHGEWKPVPALGWVCTANILFETPILPGGVAEGDFVLSTLAPAFDASALRSAGDYSLRFTFLSNACFASADGTFCLIRPKKQEAIQSPEITIRLSAASVVSGKIMD